MRRDQRADFVDAAMKVLADKAAKFNARTVAKKAGRSLGSLTFHFKGDGMHELRAATAVRGMAILGDSVRKAQALPARAPVAGLKRMGRAFIRFALERRRLFRLMLGESDEPVVGEERAVVRRLVREQVMLCQAHGVIRLGDPERLTRLVVGVCWGMAQAALDGDIPRAAAPEALDQAIDDLIAGVAPRNPA